MERGHTIEQDVSNSFKNFAAEAKKNAEAGRIEIGLTDMKLAELKKFAENFKLHTPMPQDLKELLNIGAPITAKHRTVKGKEPPPRLWSEVARGASPQAGESNALKSAGIISPSSVYSSSLSALTRSTKETQTTTQTSVSSHSNPMHSRNNTKLALGAMEDIKEDDEALVERQMSASSLGEEAYRYDEVSLVSQGSTNYTPQQRDDVIRRFSRAMLKGLRPNSNFNAANDSSRQHALPHLRSALKTFTETLEVYPSARTQVKAMKMVRRLRPEIARKFQDGVLNIDQAAETRRAPINLIGHIKQMDYSDKISRWNAMDPPSAHLDNVLPAAPDQRQAQSEANSESSFSFPTRTNSTMGSRELEIPNHDATGLYGTYIDPSEILNHFTKQPAFENLIKRTERLFERYHSQKMHLIRHRTSLSLRRYLANRKGASRPLRAVFNVDWSLEDFLKNNYEAGIHQKLDRILAVTGVIDNARLCSVREYFRWCWPRYSVQLLKAIEETMGCNNQAQNSQRELAVYL